MEAKYSPTATMISFLVFVLLASTLATLALGQGTRIGFYARSCPRAESIVQSAIKSHYQSDPTVAPGLLRMFFHDCFVNGCDASILVDGANTEKTAGPNTLLRGYEAINDAKSQLETACPGVVSCADILALAARDSVVLTGGLSWNVLTGRRDGLVSLASDASNLPGFRDSASVQIKKFADVGLNTQDLIALVGAHTIGTASCFTFSHRLYGFNSSTGADPAIDATFLPQLRALCPQSGDGSRRIGMDTGSVNNFDNSFFANLRSGKGVLESDQNLWNDPSTKNYVQRFLGLRGLLGLTFNIEFGKSMVKMGNIGVKTGTAGEIRKVCSSFN